MAEGKKSFLLYTDIQHVVAKLTDVEAGQLFKHLLAYVNDQNPTAPTYLIEIVFEPIKQSLKRDLIKYGGIKESRSYAGKLSAEKRKQNASNSTSVPCLVCPSSPRQCCNCTGSHIFDLTLL